MGTKGDFSDFEDGGWCQMGWSSRNCWSTGIFIHNQNEKIVPVVEGDWSDCFELIVTQITTGYNEGIQKSISDTHPWSKWMHQVVGGGVMLWRIFYWHTFGLLVPTEHRFWLCSSLRSYSVDVFWWLLPAGKCTIKQSSNHLKLSFWT